MAAEPSQPNPYGAPEASPERPAAAAGSYLASRTQRLAAALIDGLFAVVTGTALAVYLHAAGHDPWPTSPELERMAGGIAPSSVLALLCGLVPAALQWALIARRGQTLGKMLLGTRIALGDGRIAGFLHGVVLRMWPISVLASIGPLLEWRLGPGALAVAIVSAVVPLLDLVDVVFIFRADYRCVHDHIAGTYVVSE
jgi:uncharacterized RDD family membrane protein YckC